MRTADWCALALVGVYSGLAGGKAQKMLWKKKNQNTFFFLIIMRLGKIIISYYHVITANGIVSVREV